MTNAQTHYTAVGVAVIMGLSLLTVIVKVSHSLDASDQQVVKLQHQIDELKKINADQYEQIGKISAELAKLNKDLDDTQSLQRTQAQVIFQLKKSHK